MRASNRDSRQSKVDVLVVGAGPAGAVAARGLAAKGLGVLLVDTAKFPRWKICGCCLNGAALRALDELSLTPLVKRLGAVQLTHVHVASRGHTAKLPLPDGVALSRVRFDDALIAEAIAAGVEFRERTAAEWIDESSGGVHVALKTEGTISSIEARVVVGADGLAAGFTRRIPGVRSVPARRARIGAGTTVDDPLRIYAPHEIHMAVGSGGYVGLVRVEDDGLNVAAALDVNFVQALGGLRNAARRILEESGFPVTDALRIAQWKGTPPLTRRHEPPSSGRLFLVGDAAEYVEPFTGEGMAWALAGGAEVGSHVEAALHGAGPAAQADWLKHRNDLLRRRTRRCRWITGALRYPRLTTLAVRLLNAYPNLAGQYLDTLNQAELSRG